MDYHSKDLNGVHQFCPFLPLTPCFLHPLLLLLLEKISKALTESQGCRSFVRSPPLEEREVARWRERRRARREGEKESKTDRSQPMAILPLVEQERQHRGGSPLIEASCIWATHLSLHLDSSQTEHDLVGFVVGAAQGVGDLQAWFWGGESAGFTTGLNQHFIHLHGYLSVH